MSTEIKLPGGWHVGSAELKTWRDVPGWFSDDDILDELIVKHEVRSVIEIGCLFGRATAYFAGKLDTVYVIEPFDGAFFWGDVPPCCERMAEEFTANMKALGIGDKLVVFNARSDQVHFVEDFRVDLVYLDSAHDYESVKADLEKFGARARKVLCGDDYEPLHPGVIKAVNEYLGVLPNLSRRAESDFWYFEKEQK